LKDRKAKASFETRPSDGAGFRFIDIDISWRYNGHMKEDFSELIEYLDQKFEKTATAEGLNRVDERVGKLEVRMINVEEGLKEVKTAIADLKQTVHELVDAVDKLAKAVDDLRIEYSSLALKSDRHEKWILQLAEKLGLKLESE
jgi:predicted nuclease with TOPRIM domain